jgi:hypothetical protein
MKVKVEIELDTDRQDDKELLESLVYSIEQYYQSDEKDEDDE